MLKGVKRDFKGFLFLSSLLLVFWLLISASIDWQHVVVGLVLGLFVTAFWGDIVFTRQRSTGFTLKQFLSFVFYMCCLLYEIVKANLHVAYLVLHPRLPISPGFIIYRLGLSRELPKALFLNSITLTPGTITVQCEDDKLVVHCFTRENAEEVQEWYLYRQMKKIEDGE